MSAYRGALGRRALSECIQRLERPSRLTTGLILFAFATTHLLNHAIGIRSIAAMQDASAMLIAPWQTPVGAGVLYSSFLVHALLGLYALYRRRHLRIPAGEAWQLALALLWQIYSCRRSLQIHFRQCGHRRGGSRAKSSRMAWRTAGKVG